MLKRRKRNPRAVFFELLKSASGLYLIWQMGGDWFGAKANVGVWYVWVVGLYQLLSVLVVAGLVWTEVRDNQQLQSVISSVNQQVTVE